MARLYKDSEMVVWQSSGVGTSGIVQTRVDVVLLMVLFLVFMSVVLVPWANQKLAVYQKQCGIAVEFNQRWFVSNHQRWGTHGICTNG